MAHWYQATTADPQISFGGATEYPIATPTHPLIPGSRAQIISQGGEWVAVKLEGGTYRAWQTVPDEVLRVIDWAYAEVAPPADLIGEERDDA